MPKTKKVRKNNRSLKRKNMVKNVSRKTMKNKKIVGGYGDDPKEKFSKEMKTKFADTKITQPISKLNLVNDSSLKKFVDKINPSYPTAIDYVIDRLIKNPIPKGITINSENSNKLNNLLNENNKENLKQLIATIMYNKIHAGENVDENKKEEEKKKIINIFLSTPEEQKAKAEEAKRELSETNLLEKEDERSMEVAKEEAESLEANRLEAERLKEAEETRKALEEDKLSKEIESNRLKEKEEANRLKEEEEKRKESELKEKYQKVVEELKKSQADKETTTTSVSDSEPVPVPETVPETVSDSEHEPVPDVPEIKPETVSDVPEIKPVPVPEPETNKNDELDVDELINEFEKFDDETETDDDFNKFINRLEDKLNKYEGQDQDQDEGEGESKGDENKSGNNEQQFEEWLSELKFPIAPDVPNVPRINTSNGMSDDQFKKNTETINKLNELLHILSNKKNYDNQFKRRLLKYFYNNNNDKSGLNKKTKKIQILLTKIDKAFEKTNANKTNETTQTMQELLKETPEKIENAIQLRIKNINETTKKKKYLEMLRDNEKNEKEKEKHIKSIEDCDNIIKIYEDELVTLKESINVIYKLQTLIPGNSEKKNPVDENNERDEVSENPISSEESTNGETKNKYMFQSLLSINKMIDDFFKKKKETRKQKYINAIKQVHAITGGMTELK